VISGGLSGHYSNSTAVLQFVLFKIVWSLATKIRYQGSFVTEDALLQLPVGNFLTKCAMDIEDSSTKANGEILRRWCKASPSPWGKYPRICKRQTPLLRVAERPRDGAVVPFTCCNLVVSQDRSKNSARMQVIAGAWRRLGSRPPAAGSPIQPPARWLMTAPGGWVSLLSGARRPVVTGVLGIICRTGWIL